jgi:hypothetical protein
MAIIKKCLQLGKVKVEDLEDFPNNGYHQHIMRLACFLRGMEMEAGDAVKLIHAKFGKGLRRRSFHTNEVEDAVGEAYSLPKAKTTRVKKIILPTKFEKISPESFWTRNMPLPKVKEDPSAIRKSIGHSPWTMERMHAESPLNVDAMSPQQLLNLVFEPGELICCGSVARFSTRTAEEWSSGGWMGDQVVPSPSRARQGWTLSHKPTLSPHTRDSTGRRKYIVVESDDKDMPFDDKASVLRYLRDKTEAHLKMVVHTAGKSLHGWFKASEDEFLNFKFMELACRLGADLRMWLPEQLARLPNAIRIKNQKLQKCYYFDPS